MSSKDQYFCKMRIKLDEWNAEINALATRSGRATAGLKVEYGEQIEALRTKQTVARQKLVELQQAGESAWEELKDGIEQSWSAMGEAVDSARSHFR